MMKNTVPLNKNHLFRQLYTKGKTLQSPLLVVAYRKTKSGRIRMGITASKKIGNAVARNRARRVIKEAYRLLEDQLIPGWDLVFIARSKTTRVKMQAVQREMHRQLIHAGMIPTNETVS